MTLAVDIMDGRGHINTARHEWLPKKTKVAQYYTTRKTEPSFIKVSGQLRSDALQGRPTFSFTVIISA